MNAHSSTNGKECHCIKSIEKEKVNKLQYSRVNECDLLMIETLFLFQTTNF